MKNIASSNQIGFYKREKSFSKPYSNMIYLYKVNKDYNIHSLLYYLVSINEVFRTYLLYENSLYYQIIKDIKDVIIKAEYIYTNDIHTVINKIKEYKFNIDYTEENKDCLLKMYYIMKEHEKYICILTNHICFDDYSEKVLLNQIDRYYKGDLQICNNPYIEFTIDIEEYNIKNRDICAKWWKEYTDKYNSILNYIDIEGKSFSLIDKKVKCRRESIYDIDKLNKYCIKNRVTLFSLMTTIFQLYLYKAFNLNICTIRFPLLNRNDEKHLNIVGCLFNTGYIIKDVNDKDMLSLCKDNLNDIMNMNMNSFYDREKIKNYLKADNKYKHYMFGLLQNNESIKKNYNINKDTWNTIEADDIIQSDLYIEIWKDRIDLVYNIDIFNKENLKIDIFYELINSITLNK
jgi:hypothetical protein